MQARACTAIFAHLCTISLPQDEMFPLYVFKALVFCPRPWGAVWWLLGAPWPPL